MELQTLRKLSKFLWAGLLICLPVTSFRFIPFLGNGTFVRPLAIYPLVLLLPILAFRIYKKDLPNPFPPLLNVLVLFVLASIASLFAGAANLPIELGGVGFMDRGIRAMATLAIGLAFLLAAVWSNQNEDDVWFTVRWSMVGLIATIFWSLIQFYGLNHGWRELLTKIQGLYSARGLVKNKRVSGFAYEPSWLAGQITAVYLPWLFATILQPTQPWYPLFHNKWGGWFSDRFKVDLAALALFFGSLIVILFTYSRSGLVLAFVALGITYLLAGRQHFVSIIHWFRNGFANPLTGSKDRLKALLPRILVIITLVAIIAGAGSFLADKGYIAAFADINVESVPEYITNIYLGPRVAYLQASLAGYLQNPLFGVGPGASGFWIYQNIPDWSLAGNPEIARQLSPSTNIFPNPKNLPIKLLAETGILGFCLYLVFMLSIIKTAYAMATQNQNDRSPRSENQRWIGIAGLAGLISILILGFSQDSFAMPELWLMPGILMGVYNSGNFIRSRRNE